MENKIRDFKDLVVWQRGCEFAKDIYGLTNKFPGKEQYGLTSQLCRAAVSIPSNIAEGYCRQSTREFIRFLYISFGSTAELETQLMIAGQLKYLAEGELGDLLASLLAIRKMLSALILSLKRKEGL